MLEKLLQLDAAALVCVHLLCQLLRCIIRNRPLVDDHALESCELYSLIFPKGGLPERLCFRIANPDCLSRQFHRVVPGCKHLTSGLEAVLGLVREAPDHKLVDGRWHLAWSERSRGFPLHVEDIGKHGCVRPLCQSGNLGSLLGVHIPSPRKKAGHSFIENDTHGKDVGCQRVGPRIVSLGRTVRRSSHQPSCHRRRGHRGHGVLAQPEIDDDDVSILLADNVCRFQVTMNNALGMHCRHTVDDLAKILRHLKPRKMSVFLSEVFLVADSNDQVHSDHIKCRTAMLHGPSPKELDHVLVPDLRQIDILSLRNAFPTFGDFESNHPGPTSCLVNRALGACPKLVDRVRAKNKLERLAVELD
mmetsp:Transcript_25926/g.52839  ORF Transcript_25926/g.52839 Transcript_25926/m.52839 type:complete len:360 (+) Transcript_25926:689-1768(+)